jgi:hypothetical protein
MIHCALFLFALNGFVSFAFASCNVAFCVSQFCPPSVGDVGWCLCNYHGGMELDEVTGCLSQECDGENTPDGAVISDVEGCCGITLDLRQIR